MTRQVVRLAVKNLILQTSGTYNPMYIRPYQTHFNGNSLDVIVNRVQENADCQITGALLSGAATNVISPAATPQGTIEIPNGWNEPRVRFVLQVECQFSIGSVLIYYIQGYTDYNGISANHLIDPKMHFFINSIVTVAQVSIMTSAGMMVQDRVVESSQLLADYEWAKHLAERNQRLSMRPQDLFTGIQTQHITAALNELQSGGSIDTRNLLKTEPIKSTRTNNIGSGYLATTIDAYLNAVRTAPFGHSDQDQFSISRGLTHETSLFENPFIREISRLTGVSVKGSFTYQDLLRIDPNTERVTNLIVQGPMRVSTVHQAGQTEYWNGSDRKTVAATILMHSVSAIMMELLISKISFRSTNQSVGSQMSTVITYSQSLTNADLTQQFEIFKKRLENSILLDITYGNEESYILDMSIDLFGETWIRIAIGDNEIKEYVAASFCDNLSTPIVTASADQFYGLAADIQQIIQNCSDGLSYGATTSTPSPLRLNAINQLV